MKRSTKWFWGLFFGPLALAYVIAWISMSINSAAGLEHPALAPLLAPLQYVYAIPCLVIGFIPFAPFLVLAALIAMLALGLAKRHTAWGLPCAITVVVVQWLCAGTMIFLGLALGF